MGRLVPSLGELEAAIKPITLNTPLAGTHNEGGPSEQAYLTLGLAAFDSLKRDLTACSKGPAGIAPRENRGTRDIW